MRVIFFKELADHLNSTRFLILLTMILSVSLLICNAVGSNINGALDAGQKFDFLFLKLFTVSGSFFSLKQFIAFFGPLLGIVMGFDLINREWRGRTLSKLLCQPIHRDAVINGKYLAGLAVLSLALVSLVLMISGLGMSVMGVYPSLEEVGRLILYVLLSILYVGFWLGIAVLSSILFRSAGTSALAALSLWIFVAFFVNFGASLAAEMVAPRAGMMSAQWLLRRQAVSDSIQRLSPVNLYNEATSILLDPGRKSTQKMLLVGPMESVSMSRFDNPLPLDQSLLVIAPHLTMILAMTVLCFGVSYVVFMRQEIRAV